MINQNILKILFTKKKLNYFFIKFKLIIIGLIFLLLTQIFHTKIDESFDNLRYGTNTIVNKYFQTDLFQSKEQEISFLFQNINKNTSDTYQVYLYNEIRNYNILNGTKLIQSILLGFLYAFAYLKTIRRVKEDYMKIDSQSFLTFSLTSGSMVLVNGFVPGSVVYFESFILAGYAVFLHLQNVVNDKHNNDYTLNEALNLNPIPTSRYDENLKPIVWNDALEHETSYSHEEVLNYFEKHGEIMTLLYKGENLEKVKKYLSELKKTGEGYENVIFTMSTKSGEEKTFLWTTQPDPIIKGGNIRFARYITDVEEIK
ncbi:MAG: PAS domain-containing protein [Candidatus Gracilibacteria bacterium]|nr:PAS domain-containing protein [Candidatus Gracilibacteria bacterium]